ncbi:MAG TPA: type II toxin-antitoxin system RelE/ParE family toxin [Cyclobacteriaceae bacterium]|jgi:toxin ParE1/3/4
MSSRKYTLLLTAEAQDDLTNIQNYTYFTYGEKQWKKYGHDLKKGLAHIRDFPLSGTKRPDLPEGYLAWPVNEHVLIYRIETKTIYLVRVLHVRMDFRFQF